MNEIPSKCIENLQKSINAAKIADHILYITYPVIKDKRLLLKALEQTSESVIHSINAILQYEYFWNRIRLANSSTENFNIFKEKCANNFKIMPLEIIEIEELLKAAENHKKSPLEFLKKDKVVLVNESLKTTTLDAISLKEYLRLAKMIIERAKVGMSIE
jgi:hypothetical protein